MADAHAKPPDDHAKPPEKKKEEKPKKSMTARLIMVALATLALVVFFMVENPLLGMMFGGATDTINTTGNGFQSMGTGLIVSRIKMNILMMGLGGWIMNALMILAMFVGTAWLAQKIVKWGKPS